MIKTKLEYFFNSIFGICFMVTFITLIIFVWGGIELKMFFKIFGTEILILGVTKTLGTNKSDMKRKNELTKELWKEISSDQSIKITKYQFGVIVERTWKEAIEYKNKQ